METFPFCTLIQKKWELGNSLSSVDLMLLRIHNMNQTHVYHGFFTDICN